ncbi:MAG: hypothetical protein KIS85_00560 [Anaerolineales bacterium]|nr:hypothetical protein [Anaerolineales bacterium]
MPTLLKASQKAFVLLLRLYPRRFRQAYGAGMAQVFRDCCREVLKEAGIRGLAGLWLAALPDLFKTAFEERVKELLQMDKAVFKAPSARIPFQMSLLTLAWVLAYVGIVGVSQQADEGVPARLFQLLMAAQIPIISYFAFTWLPKEPLKTVVVVLLQGTLWLAVFLTPQWFETFARAG